MRLFHPAPLPLSLLTLPLTVGKIIKVGVRWQCRSDPYWFSPIWRMVTVITVMSARRFPTSDYPEMARRSLHVRSLFASRLMSQKERYRTVISSAHTMFPRYREFAHFSLGIWIYHHPGKHSNACWRPKVGNVTAVDLVGMSLNEQIVPNTIKVSPEPPPDLIEWPDLHYYYRNIFGDYS
ncbi:hypothetical protein C8J56DRAFT_897245 [Mycena floridula]|nr:hypothetical protein C8J56DRAFT_897245 [Mycena floridula]